jgi:hypothetical protein
VTNNLAYFVRASPKDKKGCMTLTPRPFTLKLFTDVIIAIS